MTFKHIDFHDSSVMRELERQSVKKGNVLNISVTDAIKKIAKAKFYSPTDNLFLDLVKLAEGLRAKGFGDRAEVLETKILAYKKASEQYNTELTAAHPEGDVTMGEASNGLGDVETLESAHEKIVQVVNKNPTGKQANKLIDDILYASGNILGLKKKAQDSNVDEAEDLFSGKSSARASTIKEINSFLAVEFPKISNTLKSRDVDPSRWGFTYPSVYSGSSALKTLYASYANINLEVIDSFLKKKLALFGTEEMGDEVGKILSVIQQYVNSKNFDKLIAYGNVVDGGLGTRYFSGSRPSDAKKEYVAQNPDRAKYGIYRDNPNSIWGWYGWSLNNILSDDNIEADASKLASISNEIYQAYVKSFQEAFSQDKLTLATTKIQGEITDILVPWNEVSASFQKSPEIPLNATSIASLNMAIIVQSGKLKPYLADGVLFKKLIELASSMWPGWTPNLAVLAAQVEQEIATTINFLSTKPLNPGDIIVQDTSKVVALLMGTARMYWEAGKKVNPRSAAYKDYNQNQRVTFNLAKAVKASEGKPYAALYQIVKEIFPNANTYEKLIQEAQVWMQESSGTTGQPASEYVKQTSVISTDMIKIAEGLVRKSPGATVPASNTTVVPSSAEGKKPVGNVSNVGNNRAALGLAKANMNDPKEVAVALMQQHLAYFAEALVNAESKFTNYDPQDVSRIVRTGPKANPAINTYDGKWGSETQTALELANKYLKQLGISELDTKARYTNKVTSADAEAAAKQNANTLSQGIQVLGGQGGLKTQTGTTVYDRLPDNIDWNTVEYPLMQHRIPVTSQDMSSLLSIYDLVTKHNWAQPKYNKDDQGFDIEGFTAGNLLFIIRWFQRRAQFVYNSTVRYDKSAAALARQYYDAGKRLEGQLAAYLSARGGITQETANNIVDVEALREYSTSGESENAQVPETGNRRPRNIPGGAGYQYAGYHQGKGQEGVDWKSPTRGDDGPPIGPDGVINLASRWFNGLDRKLGISHNPLLNPELFRRYSTADLARTFYAGGNNDVDQQARQQALTATGLEVERYDESAGDYIVYYYDPVTRRRTRTYAMRVPAYQRAYRMRLTSGPIRSFTTLLQAISSALAPAIAEWMNTAQPNDAAKQAEEAWHIEWQRILGLRANEAVQ